MPLYVYKCEKCGNTDEFLLKFSEIKKTEVECKHCKGKMNYQISASSFDLRGKGFYKNDYKGQ